MREQGLHVGGSPKHFISSLENDASDDNYAKTLQQKIYELSRVISEKSSEIKDLTEVLQIKELGLIECGRKVDETHRRQTHVEDELEAASREAANLKQITSALQGTVDIRNNELKEIKQKLEAEKEATMTLKVEKNMMTEKYEDLAKERFVNDKTFMHLYDELIPEGKVEVSWMNSEEKCTELEYPHVDGIEGYCFLGPGTSMETWARKHKPTRAPPPVPSQSARINKTEKLETESSIVAKYEADEAKRFNQADYEYFLMCSIAVRMNLAQLYQKDEIMAVDSRKFWPVCQIYNVPMNKYYSYIENALREEFGLPKLPFEERRLCERPIAAQCCNVM